MEWEKSMIYLKLFLSFVQVGLFSIGGGYAAIPLIRDQVVERSGWLTMAEFTDLITIAEMTPGPIAVNSATFVGIRIAGLPGAVVATAGCIFPSCVLVSLLAQIYYRYRGMSTLQSILAGLRPAVVGLIAAAGCSILQLVLFQGGEMAWTGIHWTGAVIFAAALFVLRKWKCSPIRVMLCCGAAGVAGGLIFS